MSEYTYEMPQQGIRHECPIGLCPWIYDDLGPSGLTVDVDQVRSLLLTHASAVESVVRAHLESHPLEEWVREVMRLRKQAAGTLGHALSSGHPGYCNCACGCGGCTGCGCPDGCACGRVTKDDAPLVPGPLDLLHRHPDIPVPVPVRNVIGAVLSRAVRDQAALLSERPAYSPWSGSRNPPPHPSACYRADAGFTVHVTPGCRCR